MSAVTKIATALLMLRLRDRGLVDLDEPATGKLHSVRLLDHDGGDDRGDQAPHPAFNRFFRADQRRQLVPAELAADIVRTGIAEPDHQEQKEDEFRADIGREVVAQPDRKS